MSWVAAGVTLGLLVIGAPVGADEFSMIVGRGSTVVRVTGNDDGEIHEETLREDPTPARPPAETPAGVDSDGSPPVAEEEEAPSTDETLVVVSRVQHHRHLHVRPNRHKPSRSGRGRRFRLPGSVVFPPPSIGAEESRSGPAPVRSVGRLDLSPPSSVSRFRSP